MKSTSYNNTHVAIIMDGNGRWASARGLPRLAGHRAGSGAVRRTVEAAVDLGIGALTLYAFSCDNWKRPAAEVSGLMELFRSYLLSETPRCVEQGIRLEVIGRRDRLHPALAHAIEQAERQTAGGRTLHLRIAVDYSARDCIVRAAARLRGRRSSRERFSQLLGSMPDVDLMIRTGGEQRLSDFLLWECAYAELVFTPCLWPDFSRQHLESALRDFAARERRFGALLAESVPTKITQPTPAAV
ncbi:MAG TPA: di-trans,poly-cis-decaprenylcistransferase [Bryobacteraceae bacterium]|nr:di-trans,poly-cis-decaprenylcistransferase [Bryobacteraceae bacterium]